jgi:hypothetical protein
MDLESEYFSRRNYLKTVSSSVIAGLTGFLYSQGRDDQEDDEDEYGRDCTEYSVTCAGEPEKFPEIEESSNSSVQLNESILEQE